MLAVILLATLIAAKQLKPPPFWRSQHCQDADWVLDKGRRPRPFGTFGDELDPLNDNFFHQVAANRRVHYGTYNRDTGFPWTSICNINEESDRFHWCTCTILSHIWVITARLCFRERDDFKFKTDDIPPIKVTYGSTKKSTHQHTRTVIEMIYHPNRKIDAALLKLNDSIIFTKGLQPFSPDLWLLTTGWRNFIPKCSTMMCGYGVTDEGPANELMCLFYGFTTNLETLMATGLDFDSPYNGNTSRYWLGSVNDYTYKYKLWLDNGEVAGHYGTACTGDAGSPLLYWDKPGRGQVYMIGMVTGTRKWKNCGDFGVDMAVSMISLYGWLAEHIRHVHNPTLPGQHDKVTS